MKTSIYPFFLPLFILLTQTLELKGQCVPDISWPADYTVACGDDVDPAITGNPIVGADCCSFTATHYDDSKFDNGDDGILIRRNWTVLDFCNSQEFEHLQIINVLDPDASCGGGAFVNQRTGQSYETLQEAIDDIVGEEEEEEVQRIIFTNPDLGDVELTSDVSFILENASGEMAIINTLTVNNGENTVFLEGDPFNIDEAEFTSGYIGVISNTSFNRSPGGGEGSGVLWQPTDYYPPGEPIPGVNIALEQIPGGIFMGSHQDNDDPTLESAYTPIMMEGITGDDTGNDPAGVNYSIVRNVEDLFEEVYAIAGARTGRRVRTTQSISLIDDSGAKTGGVADRFYLGFPTSAVEINGEPATDIDELGIPILVNLPDDGGTPAYLSATVMRDRTLEDGRIIESEGNNLLMSENVRPASPFVVIGCETCGNKFDRRRGVEKAKVCLVNQRFPRHSRTLCVPKRIIPKLLTLGNYCGPCQESDRASLDEGGGLSTLQNYDQPIQAYPNPASDQLTVTFTSEALAPRRIRLVDINGRTVRELVTGIGDVKAEMNVKGLPAGMYVLHVQGEAGNRQVKVMIQ